MRSKLLIAGVAVFLGTLSLPAEVIRAPLMGHILPSDPSSPAWFSETRLLNPTSDVASVTITDVVGLGDPLIRDFTIPPYGILDLRNFELFFASDPPPDFYPTFLALVEFTSDKPIVVLTQISALEPQTGSPGVPCVYHPYFGGSCFRPVSGSLLRGFRDYIPTGSSATLSWLTAGSGYRDNLFITNPGNSPLTVTATFRSSAGQTTAMRTYDVAARSMVVIGNALGDSAIRDLVGEGAVVASFQGSGQFYVFAAVLSESPACQVQPLYALVQPDLPPQ